jgi:hypothetical protein
MTGLDQRPNSGSVSVPTGADPVGFRRDGYAVLKEFLNRGELEALRVDVDTVLAAPAARL